VKRIALIGASLVLVGGLATACGSPPEDANSDDFCNAMTDLQSAGDDKGKFEDARDKIKDTGTPEEIDGDAREGFEIFVDALDDVDDPKDAEEPDLDSDEEEKVGKFMAKYTEICAGDMQEQMEEQMSDLPTDGLETEGLETE